MEKTAPLYGVAIIDEEETEGLSLEGQHMPHALHAEALGSVQAKMQVPDENELRASILRIMQQHANEGEDINIKKIRQIIEKEQNCDLSERKQWVRETVHALIAEHFADDEDEDDKTVKNREAILPIPTSQEVDKKSSVTTSFHETLCENPQACAETDDTTSSQSAPEIRLTDLEMAHSLASVDNSVHEPNSTRTSPKKESEYTAAAFTEDGQGRRGERMIVASTSSTATEPRALRSRTFEERSNDIKDAFYL